MYTILVGEDNALTASVVERVMQRSKLVDNLHFLVEPNYKNVDMTPFTVVMEYILPVSKELHSVELVKSEELYKNRLEYKIPFDTDLTAQPGDLRLQLSFVRVELQHDGSAVQYVRKTKEGSVHITAISEWSQIIPDAALTALDQRIVAMDAKIKALGELAQQTYDGKADNLVYENSLLQLTASGKRIGDAVTIGSGEVDPDTNPDGNLRVVVF